MTAQINTAVGLKAVAVTHSGLPYGKETPIEDIKSIVVVNALCKQSEPRFAVCVSRKLPGEQFIHVNNRWIKVRGQIPDAVVDDLPDYTAYGLPATDGSVIYETAVVLSVGGPGTHEILTAEGWKLQPGGLRFARELRISGQVITSNPNAIEHARRVFETVKYLEPFVYFGDSITVEGSTMLRHCLHCGWGHKCGCPEPMLC